MSGVKLLREKEARTSGCMLLVKVRASSGLYNMKRKCKNRRTRLHVYTFSTVGFWRCCALQVVLHGPDCPPYFCVSKTNTLCRAFQNILFANTFFLKGSLDIYPRGYVSSSHHTGRIKRVVRCQDTQNDQHFRQRISTRGPRFGRQKQNI